MAKHMTPDDINTVFESWCEAHSKPAWLPSTSDTQESTSFFGGSPEFSSSSEWPCCDGCKKPMLFFMQLDLSTLPAEYSEATGTGFVQLYHCDSGDGMCESYLPFAKANEVRFFNHGVNITTPVELETLRKKSIVSWSQHTETPHPEEHETYGISYDYDFAQRLVTIKCKDPALVIEDLDIDIEVAEIISTSQPGDKLGGWSYWVQSAEYPKCPKCQSLMDVVMQIDSEINLDYMFGDSGVGHISRCKQHPDIFGFGWACC
ncbi:MAG: DUF1963 domain-containing protein [Gammaproteobacteria bacterium]